jgi:hypothetical protein
MDAVIHAAIPELFYESCPGSKFQFGDVLLETSEAASQDGFLPIVMAQALATASVIGGIPGVSTPEKPGSMTGKEAIILGDAPVCLLLPFLLDALETAREKSIVSIVHNRIVRLEKIDPAQRPMLFDLLLPFDDFPAPFPDSHQPE